MIDGVLLLTELGLMLVLVVTVWRARQKGREDHLGLFAYKATLEPPPAIGRATRRTGHTAPGRAAPCVT